MTKLNWEKANQSEKLQRPFNQGVYGTNLSSGSLAPVMTNNSPREAPSSSRATFIATDYDEVGKPVLQVHCKICREKKWIIGFQLASEWIREHETCE